MRWGEERHGGEGLRGMEERGGDGYRTREQADERARESNLKLA